MQGNIFGRPIPESIAHIGAELTRLESHGTEVDRAIAENLRADDRVTIERAALFFDRCKSIASAVQSELNNHKNYASGDEFRDLAINGENLIYEPRELSEPGLPIKTEFATIVRLFSEIRSQLRSWLRENRIRRTNGDDIGDGTGVDEVDQWLGDFDGVTGNTTNDELRMGIAEAHMRLLELQSTERKLGRTSYSERVVWVGRLDEFSRHRESGPRCWLEIFGLGHFLEDLGRKYHDSTEEWLLLLIYPMHSTSVVARPCILDAGSNQWHFPTPGYLPIEEGGRTMILGEALNQNVQPLAEFIHNQRKIEKEDVAGIYRFAREHMSVTPPDLKGTREKHRRWLDNWIRNSGDE